MCQLDLIGGEHRLAINDLEDISYLVDWRGFGEGNYDAWYLA
jgi:hypothetical protein